MIFRGDASRLPGWTKGYGRFDNPEIMARPFSVGKAREYFAKAGCVKEDENGILMKENGERLEVALTFSNIPVGQDDGYTQGGGSQGGTQVHSRWT